jgi:hypothetical protein
MRLLGYSPNLGDFQHEAWKKALRLFPTQAGFNVESWIPEGLKVLDLDGTEIGRHLGPEVSQFPLYGDRRPIGISRDGVIIPYDQSEMEGPMPSIHIPWSKITPGFDVVHFGLAAEVCVTLRLSEEAAVMVRARLEALHG